MIFFIRSANDIRIWLDRVRYDVRTECGGDAVDRVVKAIQHDDHPPYGTNWADYLASDHVRELITAVALSAAWGAQCDVIRPDLRRG